MKLETVVFTHPTAVFNNNATGMLSILPNQSERVVDSIEVVGSWIIVTRDGKTKAVPSSKVESADILNETKPLDAKRK